MLTAYIQQALQGAVSEKMENGRWFFSLPAFPGVWAEAEDIESARSELGEVLEEWIILSLKRGNPLPVIGQMDLNSVGVTA